MVRGQGVGGTEVRRTVLRRLRRLFALLTGVGAAGALLQLWSVGVGRSPVAVGAVVGLAGWAVLTERRGDRWWALDVLPLLLLAALAVTADPWYVWYPLLHIVLFQRALDGSARRVYAGAALISSGWVAVGVATSESAVEPVLVGLVVGGLLSSWLLRQVALLAARVERSGRREGRLLAAARDLAAATRQAEVDQVVVEAAAALVGQVGARAVLWEENDQEWTVVASAGPARISAAAKARLPPAMVDRAERGEPWRLGPAEAAELQAAYGMPAHYQGYVYVPVPRRERPRAMLALSCPAPADDDLPEMLRRFAQEASIAEDRARLAARVADREARLASVLEGSIDVIALLDDDGNFTLINRATTAVHGFDPAAMLGRNVFDLIPEDARGQVLRDVLTGDLEAGVQVAHRLVDAHGNDRQVETNISRPRGADGGFVLNVRDVTERKALEAEIVYQAHHDPLTGLANRRSFTDRLEQALARAARRDTSVGLILLDLDDFKPVNDAYGHQAGDEVLTEAARRIAGGVRESDLPARMGGDEFAVVVETVTDPLEVAELAQRLEESLTAPFPLSGDRSCRVTASVGTASSWPGAGPSDLLREADQALYVAKHARHEQRRPARAAEAGAAL